MSNERIDLKQFEGMTEGVWFESERIDANYRIRNEKYEVCDVFSTGTMEGSFNAEAIAKLPNLIAELKRCYEEIDYLNALTNSLPIEMLVEADNKLQASE
jgi:hypothetical protein